MTTFISGDHTTTVSNARNIITSGITKESYYKDRTTYVNANNNETITGNYVLHIDGLVSETFKSDVTSFISGDHTCTVSNAQNIIISGITKESYYDDHTTYIDAASYETITGKHVLHINGLVSETYKNDVTTFIDGDLNSKVKFNVVNTVEGTNGYTLDVTNDVVINSSKLNISTVGITSFSNSIDSLSKDTGAVTIKGGLGIGSSACIGKKFNNIR